MFKRVSPILIALTVLLAACGGGQTDAPPTLSPADVEGTAMASALTMVAATQLAIPTNTSLPPTEIPSPTTLPTFTPVSLPTLAVPALSTPTTAPSTGGNPCLGPIDFGQAGKTCRIRIENETGGTLSPISLNLWTPNAFGQCGAMSMNIGVNGKEIVSIPAGSWWGYAWVNFKNGTQSTSSGSWTLGAGCEDLGILKVGKDVMSMKSP
ncbi:MAG: hypothetical protein HYZ23_10645 [Chloroflexi bacterium]|nr:hypothetical protein [Chloroflexota bacterium]